MARCWGGAHYSHSENERAVWVHHVADSVSRPQAPVGLPPTPLAECVGSGATRRRSLPIPLGDNAELSGAARSADAARCAQGSLPVHPMDSRRHSPPPLAVHPDPGDDRSAPLSPARLPDAGGGGGGVDL